MSAQGIAILRIKLEMLKKERTKLLKQRAETNRYGFSHTSEDAAQEGSEDAKQLGFVKTKIDDIERQLQSVRVAPVPTQFDRVQMGHMVTVLIDRGDGKPEPERFIIGGEGESEEGDSLTRIISYNSAWGKILIGKEVDDEIEFKSLRSRSGVTGTILRIELPVEFIAKSVTQAA